jgi:Amt family ammonium transporter
VNAGDTAWVMVSAALVLFMTAGLAFFYQPVANSRRK